MADLHWTTQRPTERGWYWFRRGESRPVICWVGLDWVSYGSGRYRLEELQGEWYGPLVPPGGEADEGEAAVLARRALEHLIVRV